MHPITYRGILDKGSDDCRSAVYINYLSIPLHTNSEDDIIRTLFENSPVGTVSEVRAHK